jgi:hypothetical protein
MEQENWLSYWLASLCLFPRAHASNTGLGPFYDGIAHFFLSPEELLPAVALMILAGLRGPRYERSVLLFLPLAWILGASAGAIFPVPAHLGLLVTILPAVLGVLVASDWELPHSGIVAISLFLGLLHRYLNGGASPGTQLGVFGIAGTASAVIVVVLLLDGQVATVRAHWARLVVGVAGSWITAIGLLMLGWAFRGATSL